MRKPWWARSYNEPTRAAGEAKPQRKQTLAHLHHPSQRGSFSKDHRGAASTCRHINGATSSSNLRTAAAYLTLKIKQKTENRVIKVALKIDSCV